MHTESINTTAQCHHIPPANNAALILQDAKDKRLNAFQHKCSLQRHDDSSIPRLADVSEELIYLLSVYQPT